MEEVKESTKEEIEFQKELKNLELAAFIHVCS